MAGDPGLRYVTALGNDTTGDGLDWDTGYATISKAVSDLQTTPPRGGTVQLGLGDFITQELDIVADQMQINIVGLGRGASNIVPRGTFCIKFSGTAQRQCSVRDLSIRQDGTDFNGRAIWIQDADNVVLERVWMNNIGSNYGASVDIDTDPCCVYISGTGAFSDWHKLNTLDLQNSYRGIVLADSAAAMVHEATIRGSVNESVYVSRRTLGGQSSGSDVQLSQCWFAGTDAADGYLLRFETDVTAPNPDSASSVIGCRTEPNGENHIFCDQGHVKIIGHSFIGGPTAAVVRYAVNFGSQSRSCNLSGYTRTSSGFTDPEILDNGTGNIIYPDTVPATISSLAENVAPGDTDVIEVSDALSVSDSEKLTLANLKTYVNT